jgi:hypothetical protein
MHVDDDHPRRLSRVADSLNRSAGKIRAALDDQPDPNLTHGIREPK